MTSPVRSGWIGAALLPVILLMAACEEEPAGDGEAAAEAAEEAPVEEPDIEPFEGTFTVDTARIPADQR